jgi:hypothetical protein
MSLGPAPAATPGAPGPPLPGWLGPLVSVTTQVGVPTVVAGVLLWFVLFRVDGTLKLIQDQEETRTRMVSAMQDTLVAALDRQNKSFADAIDKNIQFNKEALMRLEQAFRSAPEARP